MMETTSSDVASQSNCKKQSNTSGRPVHEVTSWNDFFMNVAQLAAGRSKDPKTLVGACIISKENVVLGVGYNCMPRGRDDLFDHWNVREDKLDYVCHAELNAIVNSRCSDFTDCKMYVTRIPCQECAKLIIQSNIKEVYYIGERREPITELMFHNLKCEGFSLNKFKATNPKHMI